MGPATKTECAGAGQQQFTRQAERVRLSSVRRILQMNASEHTPGGSVYGFRAGGKVEEASTIRDAIAADKTSKGNRTPCTVGSNRNTWEVSLTSARTGIFSIWCVPSTASGTWNEFGECTTISSDFPRLIPYILGYVHLYGSLKDRSE
jgi:hypothetical protein